MEQSQWQELIKEWENSGKTQKDFCENNGLKFKDFKRWRTQGLSEGLFTPRVRSLPKNSSTFQTFSEIKLDDDSNHLSSHNRQSTKHLEVCLPYGIVLKLPI